MTDQVNDEVQMELEMLRAIAGEDNVEPPAVRSDAPTTMRTVPSVRILVARDMSVAPEIILWLGFHDPTYPGGADASCNPQIVVQLEPSAPIRHRPEALQEEARTAAAAEGGQMCINQVYQRIVEAMVEAEEASERAAHNAAQAEVDAAAVQDPTIRSGNQMSMEAFSAWKTRFDAEIEAKRAQEERAAGGGRRGGGAGGGASAAGSGQLTGKQMWQRDISGADFSLFEGDAGDDADAEDIDFVFGDDEEEEEDGDGAEGQDVEEGAGAGGGASAQ